MSYLHHRCQWCKSQVESEEKAQPLDPAEQTVLTFIARRQSLPDRIELFVWLEFKQEGRWVKKKGSVNPFSWGKRSPCWQTRSSFVCCTIIHRFPPLHRFLSLDGRLFDRAFYTWVIYYSWASPTWDVTRLPGPFECRVISRVRHQQQIFIWIRL